MTAKRDITIYLKDIIESAQLIENYIEGISEGDFYTNPEKQDAVLHRIQIIGEAAKHIPEEYRQKWDQISWKEVAGMRDILVHEYFGVSLGMVWKVAIDDIPVLKNQVFQLLNQGRSG